MASKAARSWSFQGCGRAVTCGGAPYAVGRSGLELAAQVFGAPVHQQHTLEGMRVQRVRGGPVGPVGLGWPKSVRVGGAAGGSGLGKPAMFPGAAGELEQDGQG